jgi:hypothetical protein
MNKVMKKVMQKKKEKRSRVSLKRVEIVVLNPAKARVSIIQKRMVRNRLLNLKISNV